MPFGVPVFCFYTVQLAYGYQNTLRLLELRPRNAEVARAMPGLRGVEHVRRGGAGEQEGSRLRRAGHADEAGRWPHDVSG